jgi:Nucleotidyltransferase of unknown function (DUF6036)
MHNRSYPHLENAVSKMLDKINDLIKFNVKEPVKMYLAGGMAMNFYCGTRYTEDVDAFFSRRILIPNDMTIPYKRPDEKDGLIYFDTQYNPTFGLLHEHAEDDAVFWAGIGNENRMVHLYLLSPVDLAVSKISRFSDQDQEDIIELAKAGLINAESLRSRAEVAIIDYIGNVENVKNSINIICDEIQNISTLKLKPN